MFEAWSRVVGGILHTAGLPGFLGNLECLYSESDSEGEAWRAFIERWWERFKFQDVTAGDLHEIAELLELGNGNERSQRTRLGKLLSGARCRQFGKFRIEKGGLRGGFQHWRLLDAHPQ